MSSLLTTRSTKKSVKHFLTFITEARTTKASQQAKRLGLVGDGHGDWYDQQGNLKAKTVNGELKMFGGGSSSDDEIKDKPEPYRDVSRVAQSPTEFLKTRRGAQLATTARQRDPEISGGRPNTSTAPEPRAPLTVAFDKFDDEEITTNVLNTVGEISTNENYYIFPSRESDIEELKNAYPEISESIIDDKNAETIYDVLQSLYENGYDAVNIVVRRSRAAAISKLAYEQNGVLYNYKMLNVIPVDERSVREQYLAGDIFQKGSVIECRGHTGEIIRRGANHLICIDENKEMFRVWISEANEVSKFDLPIEF